MNYHGTSETIASTLNGGDIQSRFYPDGCFITLFQYNSYENQVAKITWKAETNELSIWEHQDPKVRRSGDLQKILDALKMDLQKAS